MHTGPRHLVEKQFPVAAKAQCFLAKVFRITQERNIQIEDKEGKLHIDEWLISMLKDIFKGNEVISILKEVDIQNMFDSNGNTLLHIAAQHDNEMITQHAIKSGCDINVQNNLGKTPILVAIENYSRNCTSILLEANADIFITDNSGKNALNLFLDDRWLRTLYMLYKFLKKVESQCQNSCEVIANKLMDAEWPLPCVALLRNIEITKTMLERGCPVDAQDPIVNRTALHEAVLVEDIEHVKLLLDYDADPNLVDRFLRSPIYYLYDRNKTNSEKQLEILKVLVGKGALTVTTTDNSSLSQVDDMLKYGNFDVIQTLLRGKLDLNRKHDNDNTPVHILVTNENPDVFKVLEDHKFDVDARNSSSETPLWIAASLGNTVAVELLLEKGADVDAANNNYRTPLRRCIKQYSSEREGHFKKCVQLLLEYGADVQFDVYSNPITFEEHPITAFGIALQNSFWVMTELLIAHLVLQEARGTPIDEYILHRQIRRTLSNANYYDFCKQQLAIKLHKSQTLLDLLSVSDNEFEKYARDPHLATVIENFGKEWQSKLYYYNEILQRRYSQAIQALNWRKEAAVFICKIMKTEYYRFPLIADQIVSYLDWLDLRNFTRVPL